MPTTCNSKKRWFHHMHQPWELSNRKMECSPIKKKKITNVQMENAKFVSKDQNWSSASRKEKKNRKKKKKKKLFQTWQWNTAVHLMGVLQPYQQQQHQQQQPVSEALRSRRQLGTAARASPSKTGSSQLKLVQYSCQCQTKAPPGCLSNSKATSQDVPRQFCSNYIHTHHLWKAGTPSTEGK